MGSSDLWTDFDSRFGEIFMMISEEAFAGISVVTVADMLQLSPNMQKMPCTCTQRMNQL